MDRLLAAITAALLFAVVGCGEQKAAWGDAPPLSLVNRVAPPTIEAQLEQFREGLGDPPTALAGGARSKDALIRRLLAALETRDTAAIRAMTTTPAEYAWLYFPSSPFTKPPYRQAPRINWMLMRADSEKGITRVMRRLGGNRLTLVEYACDPEPYVERENRFWRNCRLTLGIGNETVTQRFFGPIWERDGEFKFYSYVNDY